MKKQIKNKGAFKSASLIVAETFIDRSFTSAERFAIARLLVDKMNNSDRLKLSLYTIGKARDEV